MSRRVVITGLGLVTPLGCDVEIAWQRLLNGESGVRALAPEIAAGTHVGVAGRVPSLDEDPEAGWDVNVYLAPKDQRRVDRFIEFAIGAADQALAQAAWKPQTLPITTVTITEIRAMRIRSSIWKLTASRHLAMTGQPSWM